MRPAVFLVAIAAWLAPGPSRAAPPRPARVAIVVGANAAAPGRAALRHAHRDSEAIAGVLRSVGRFGARDVHVLHDPAPEEVLRLVEREAAALAGNPEAMLLFYYSGHSDRDALYPGGRPLALDRLRRALDRPEVAVRVGVIDACQGGGWTRAKGLVPDAPFEVTIPAVLGSEGSALIASSSGAESAHESDLLQGSFFTYHFAAALRGAGDRSGDGTVTLTEAFEYARERTIRDSARHSPEPQHPSYALNVRGRQDIVLAHVTDSPSTLALEQEEGPLELVHLASGLRVLELPAGERTVSLAVPPGKYLVRKVAQEGIRTREIAVPRDGAARVAEGELVLLGNERLAVKGARAGRGALPGRGEWELEIGSDVVDVREFALSIATGERLTEHGFLRLDGRLGITDRLTWKMGTLGFAYGLGEPGRWELVPYGGITAWSVDLSGATYEGAPYDYLATAAIGAGARMPFGPAALVWTVGVDQPLGAHVSYEAAADYVARAALGLTLRLGRYVTLHAAAGLETRWYPGFEYSGTAGVGEEPVGVSILAAPPRRVAAWSVGSVQELGLAQLPLLAVHAPRGWSLTLYAKATTIDHQVTRGYVRAGVAKAF